MVLVVSSSLKIWCGKHRITSIQVTTQVKPHSNSPIPNFNTRNPLKLSYPSIHSVFIPLHLCVSDLGKNGTSVSFGKIQAGFLRGPVSGQNQHHHPFHVRQIRQPLSGTFTILSNPSSFECEFYNLQLRSISMTFSSVLNADLLVLIFGYFKFNFWVLFSRCNRG